MSNETNMRRLTESQLRCLKCAERATDSKVGLRVSYWPQGRALERRGLLEKRGRSIHRNYFITEAGRQALADAKTLEE